MVERKSYPAGVPCWVDIAHGDVRAAVTFYAGLFDWQISDATPPGSPGRYYVARCGGSAVAGVAPLAESAPGAGGRWSTYISVDDADAVAGQVRDAGGQVLTPPIDVPSAGRVAVCADPASAVFGVWQARGFGGAELVNAPGAWNWSDLNANDLAGARAFYAAVFGWETTPVDLGRGESFMVRRPGYSDFLEQIDPGVRQRHLDAGAPEGFTDAIAWMQPLSPSEREPHWAVTFSVDDTDARAERVARLGGTVLVEPVDVPYSRMAVVRDPQGAVFSISKFVPPS